MPSRPLPAAGPPPPDGLGDAGLAVWAEAWCAGWLSAVQDVAAVAELARLEDEQATYRATLARLGPVLEEPIVSPTGEIVGTRIVLNPVEAALRRAGRAARELRQALSLTPSARVRLQLDVANTARSVEQVLAARTRGGSK